VSGRGVSCAEREAERLQHVLQLARAVAAIVVAVSDQRKLVEGEAERQRGLGPTKVLPRGIQAARVPSVAVGGLDCLRGGGPT